MLGESQQLADPQKAAIVPHVTWQAALNCGLSTQLPLWQVRQLRVPQMSTVSHGVPFGAGVCEGQPGCVPLQNRPNRQGGSAAPH